MLTIKMTHELKKLPRLVNKIIPLLFLISVGMNIWQSLPEPKHKVDNFPADQHLNFLEDRYVCSIYHPQPPRIESTTISLTSIPPRFGYLKDLEKYSRNDTNVIVNVPKTYRYFPQYVLPKTDKVIINSVSTDLGPGTKLMGLCENMEIVGDLVIYLDDDVEYDSKIFDEVKKHMSPGYIVGGHGGFYTGIDDPNLSFLGYGYFNQRFALDPCYIDAQVLMGFGGVAILKQDLFKLCRSPNIIKYTSKKSCYFIDDDWLGKFTQEVGLKKISYAPLIMSRDVFKSETDGWSNRVMYHQARKDCLKEEGSFVDSPKLLIRTALIEGKESLHKASEYKSMKKMVRQNHYNFANAFNHDYKLYFDTKLEKSHWVKIEIYKEFLQSCVSDDILFYTDYDFLFLNNIIPKFTHGSIIMAKGCSYDDEMTMVGTFIAKCDKSLIDFVDQWLKVTRICSDMGVKNDDQIAFNLIKYDLAYKLQIEDFYRYDICEEKAGLVGIHYPGGNKADRMTRTLSKLGRVS